MFDGQLLIQGSTVYSPWFKRGGDSVRITVDVLEISGATLKVELFTKKADDAGDGSNADSQGTPTNITRTTVGRGTTTEWDQSVTATISLYDLVRYKFTVTGSSTDWVLFRMLEPQWYDSAEA